MDTAKMFEALDRLNATEREMLLLLGRGHTAKTIAMMKDVSVAAVNERFRSARRKTGMGSSREIARLLVAQENRDDLIDLGATSSLASNLLRPDAPPFRGAFFTRRWRLILITTALLAAGLLAYQTGTPPRPQHVASQTTSAATDIPTQHRSRPDIDALRAEVASGSRDDSWSPRAEQALARSYHGLTGFDENITSVKITCTSSVCEVTGATRPDLSSADRTRLMSSFLALSPSDEQVKLAVVSHRLGYRPDGHEAGVFVAYWRRVS